MCAQRERKRLIGNLLWSTHGFRATLNSRDTRAHSLISIKVQLRINHMDVCCGPPTSTFKPSLMRHGNHGWRVCAHSSRIFRTSQAYALQRVRQGTVYMESTALWTRLCPEGNLVARAEERHCAAHD